ncbi:hypothetical protein [Bradyrhizobium sp. ISRA432]|uniref:hypothetical protein n=1 Tax=Bradyrhizobium sp. ISRA432 TaxID=2866193 RepID=UPI002478BC6E|nr:hypothetical protein [Bradyrhizobium sp. ISRA432]
MPKKKSPNVMPPYCVTAADLDQIYGAIRDAADALAEGASRSVVTRSLAFNCSGAGATFAYPYSSGGGAG